MTGFGLLLAAAMEVGCAVNAAQVSGKDAVGRAIAIREFDSWVAENVMKMEVIHPQPDVWRFERADALVKLAEENGKRVYGHCLFWHSQCPDWWFKNADGTEVTAETLKSRMREYARRVMGRYAGRIAGWDVVNEAIEDDGTLRNSGYRRILGDDWVEVAFRIAHEADPKAQLYYNDYGLSSSVKRQTALKILKRLKDRGVRVDSVGMQCHLGLDAPSTESVAAAMEDFAKIGLKVHVSEFDLSALPWVSDSANVSDTAEYAAKYDPYRNGLPPEVQAKWDARLNGFLDMLETHKIERFTVWGVRDGDSWKNDFPIRGRRDYPLLFDREGKMKSAWSARKGGWVGFKGFEYKTSGANPDARSGASATNPILPGCFPDPAIVGVNGDYYLVNSSFAYFPGIPIWHSRDLKNWTRLGNVLTRESQLPISDGTRIDGGLFAPAISYNPHNKLFYVIVTAVMAGGGNFFVTSPDPKSGEWSEPTYLPEVRGIDPSFLFDTDGKAYIVNNDEPEGPAEYDGHRAIRVREFDWRTGKVVAKGEDKFGKVILDKGIHPEEKPIWIEGPHLYHIGAHYYLMCAEGGTAMNHSEVVLKGDSPWGPFTPCAKNPILTQRHLPTERENPVTMAGHADLVQAPDGTWRAVFLAVRPYAEEYDVMGRETFMMPVSWEGDQPFITTDPIPAAPRAVTKHIVEEGRRNFEAVTIRGPLNDDVFRMKGDVVALKMSGAGLDSMQRPAAIGVWASENRSEMSVTIKGAIKVVGQIAGLTVFHDDNAHLLFGKTLAREGKEALRLLVRTKEGGTIRDVTAPIPAGKNLQLVVTLNEKSEYAFLANGKDVFKPIAAKYFSTKMAGGFTGTFVGIANVYEVKSER